MSQALYAPYASPRPQMAQVAKQIALVAMITVLAAALGLGICHACAWLLGGRFRSVPMDIALVVASAYAIGSGIIAAAHLSNRG